MPGLLDDAELQLQRLGIRHAPIQQCKDSTVVDGRYVTFQTPVGSYYLLSVDARGDELRGKNIVQLLFWGVQETSEAIADFLGWEISERGEVQLSEPHPEGTKMFSALLVPPKANLIDPPRQLSAA